MSKYKDNDDFRIFRNMSETQKRQALKSLAKKANNRIYKLRRLETKSPALSDIERRLLNRRKTKYFSETGAGMSENAILIELLEISNFLERKTSTITGWKDTQRRFFETMKEKGFDVEEKDRDSFYDFMEHVKEMSYQYFIPSSELVEMFYELNRNEITFDDMQGEWKSFIAANRTTEVEEYAKKLRNFKH